MNAGLEFLFWILFFSLIAIVTVIVEIVERRRDALPEPHHTASRSAQREEWQVGAGGARIPFDGPADPWHPGNYWEKGTT